MTGLKALDFSRIFPLNAKGNPPQLSLLKAVRATVVDRTMPLKIYTAFYPFRKIRTKDETAILNWLDPLIESIEDFVAKYAEFTIDPSPTGRVKKIFMNKCFRCHANGNNDGGFGDMQKLDALKKSSYVDLDKPTESILYKITESGEMPTNPRERLSEAELQDIVDWINDEKID